MEPEASIVDELVRWSTPAVVNALKELGVEARDIATTDRSIGCISPSLGVTAGYAATARVWISEHGPHETDDPGLRRRFLEHILDQSGPRVAVVQNIGEPDGRGCFWGEVQANLHRALDCRGGITNGPVRDIDEMEAAGFQAFASGVAPGGAYHQHVAVGEAVTVAGLTVSPGDLLHGDRHGVVKVPLDLAARIPEAARRVEGFEQSIVSLCRSSNFVLDDLPGMSRVKH